MIVCKRCKRVLDREKPPQKAYCDYCAGIVQAQKELNPIMKANKEINARK